MKRDNIALDKRIKELAVAKKHIAMRCGINAVTLARIIKGVDGYRNKETIERIHKYLDTVKT
jgi:predicted transcriptional regulator